MRARGNISRWNDFRASINLCKIITLKRFIFRLERIVTEERILTFAVFSVKLKKINGCGGKKMFTMMKLNENRSRIFFNYMISHLVTILIALVFFVATYLFLDNMLINNAYEENFNSLQQSSFSVDQLFISGENLILQLTFDTNFISINGMSTPLENDDKVLSFIDYNKTLNSLVNISGSFDHFTIYLKSANVLFSDGDMVLRQTATLAMLSEQNIYNLDWAAFCEDYEESGYCFFPIDDYTYLFASPAIEKSLGMVYSIRHSASNVATVCLFFDKSRLDSIFEQSGTEDYFLILDDSNNILYANNEADYTFLQTVNLTNSYDEITLEGERYIVCSVESEVNDFKYVSLTAKSTVLSQINVIKQGIIIGLIVLVVLLAGLSYFFTYHTFKPIAEFFQKLHPNRKITKEVIHKATEHIDAILLENNAYKGKIEAQVPIIKSSLCERLILGNIASAIQLEEILSSYHILLNLAYTNLLLLTIKSNEAAENSAGVLNVTRIIICEQLIEIFGEEVLFCDVEQNQIAVIVTLEVGSDYESILGEKLQYLQKRVDEILSKKIKIYTVASRSFSNVLTTASYFQNLKIQSEYLMKKDVPFYVFKSNERHYETFTYSMEVETNLIANVCGGNTEKVKLNLAQIFASFSRNISPQDFNRGLFALNTTLNRCKKVLRLQFPDYDFLSDEMIEKRLGDIPMTISIRELEAVYLDIFTSLSLTVEQKDKMETSDLIEQIKTFIKENYQDPLLSQSLIANHYNISESYLSRCFKQYTKETYSDYLVKLRMAKANELLLHSDEAINTIAERTGFNSPQVFRRTFKQFYGITPNEHKKIAKR